jgi:class 3 adenylate cyclase/tetratricopeptide (TPR) repeat protein
MPADHRNRIASGVRQPEADKTASEHDETRRGGDGIRASSRDAERRHLTILFVDMVDSTPLARRLDPEDLADVLNAFHATCNQLVERFGGCVAKNLGDGLAAYFGWPESHEHDAERAVLAGLELIEAVKAIPTGGPDRIQVHVGIATGEVVVGDVVRMDRARVHEVFGELPSLGARLQAASPPDSVLVSAETHELIRHKFVCVDVGRKKLKGFHEPKSVYHVIGPREFSLNFDARSATGLTPLIGRAAELEFLKTRWQQAAAGDGQIVLLSGEAGIGKSRLCAELRSSLDEQNFSSLSFQCSPLHGDSPLYPVTRSISQIAELSETDSAETKQRKLELLFGDLSEDRLDDISLLAAHLGIPAAANSQPALASSESFERRRMILHRLLTNFVLGLALHRPVLITFEDIHWMDPTTSEFLGTLINQLERHAVLLILTSRPALSSPWHVSECQTLLTLERLSRKQTAQFIDVFTSVAKLPHDLITGLVERSDGNPLYIEELTAAVLSGPRTRNSDVLPDSGARIRTQIPATLQESLLARIDRTSPQARELIQLCAVVGRRFAHAQISAIAGFNDNKLDETLAELVHHGLLHSTGRSPDIEYSFKHALIQDAAYSILLREKRQRFHARCAAAAEAHFPSICEHDPGVLGRHHEIAGNMQAAVPYFLTAGQLAIERSALREATTYLQKGLALLETLPESESRNSEELRFRSLLGRICIFAEGWAHQSVKKEYGRALELAKSLGLKKEQVPLEWALTTYHLLRGEIRQAALGGQRVLGLAEHVKDQDLLLVAHSAATIYEFYSGNFVGAVSHKDQALHFHRAQASGELQKNFGTDRRLQALRGAALSYWCLGNHQLAIKLDEEQRSLAKNSGQLFDHAYALTISCILHSLRRDAEMTYSFAETAIEIAQDQGFNFLEANAANFRAIALALLDPADRTLHDCDKAIESYQAAGNRMGISSMLAIMAELFGRMGRPDCGLLYVDRALDYVRRSGERFAQSDLYRVKGELLAAKSSIGDAQRCLNRALLLARTQHAKTWEFGAAIPLAQILLNQSEFEKARGLLQPLCDEFKDSTFVSDQLTRAQAICAQCSISERSGLPQPEGSMESTSRLARSRKTRRRPYPKGR